jgi:hypothetical protein
MRSRRSALPILPRYRAAAVPLASQRYTGRMSPLRRGRTLLYRVRQVPPQRVETWEYAPAYRRIDN